MQQEKMHSSSKNVHPRREGGGTLTGIIVGLILGLLIAVGVAITITKTPSLIQANKRHHAPLEQQPAEQA